MSTAIETADRTVPREWSVPRLDDLAFLAVLAAMAAATLALLTTAMPAAAEMAGGATTGTDAAMERHLLRDCKNLGQRTWVNSMMPAATGAAAPAASADQHIELAPRPLAALRIHAFARLQIKELP